MKKQHTKKLIEAEDKLNLKIPESLFDFISRLKKPEVELGKEEWSFWTLSDKIDDANDNFIVNTSLDFRKEWGLDGLVFADNGIGDYLVLLKNENSDSLKPQIFVMMHETAELKLFAESWEDLMEGGPEDYFWTERYYVKLNEEEELVWWTEGESQDNPSEGNEYVDDDYKLRSHLDDLIDDERTELTSEIIIGLEYLAECNDEMHKVWALNKLSDIYLRGFGPVPADLNSALNFNQRAMDLNSHKAYSNRAACYFAGIGMPRDLNKALEYATKANELSKSNIFADVLATKKDGGMYDSLVDMIKKEIKKAKG